MNAKSEFENIWDKWVKFELPPKITQSLPEIVRPLYESMLDLAEKCIELRIINPAKAENAREWIASVINILSKEGLFVGFEYGSKLNTFGDKEERTNLSDKAFPIFEVVSAPIDNWINYMLTSLVSGKFSSDENAKKNRNWNRKSNKSIVDCMFSDRNRIL